ncbi:MAG TPA: alpha/beta fold hydrolase [Nitrososphaeraceae archaeon]|nr:alpha/beta fold hydrolase [Nitrososphaeraceae archaeon]
MNQSTSTFFDAYLDGLRLANTYNSIYLRAFEKAVEEEREDVIEATMGGGDKGTISSNRLESLYNRWLKKTDEQLEGELKSEYFTSLLSKYTQSLLELRSFFKNMGYTMGYVDWMFAWYVKSFMVFSLIRKESHLAPFDVVYRKGKARLLHYRNNGQDTSSTISKKQQQPLLIIYAPINTFHIMDLNPRRSIVRDLLASGGLDIYLLDWGYPDWSDNKLSLEDYLGYVADAVKVIREQTSADKTSILGYCWGGIFALIHAALNPKEVRNLVLMAAPVDFSKDNAILTTWSRAIDVDSMMDEFGHMDGQVLNLGFLMRNPPRYGFDKYLKFFQRFYDWKFVDTFIDVERWLYDTPPIPGPLFRQITNDCYRNNLLISGDMEVIDREGRKQKVNIQKNITMPVLSVIAQQDDLVSPASSLAINDHILSKDTLVLENPGGHVALCISNTTHKKLWPEVANWLLSR